MEGEREVLDVLARGEVDFDRRKSRRGRTVSDEKNEERVQTKSIQISL